MLPPLTIATTGPFVGTTASSAPLNTAAVVAAPLGSATSFALAKIHKTALMMSGSSTVITASTNR
jgi:hypothetical protein